MELVEPVKENQDALARTTSEEMGKPLAQSTDEAGERNIAEADGVPFLAEFTFGEYGFEQDGLNATGGLMLSFTALG